MTDSELKDLYFDWMYQLVYSNGNIKRSYKKLLTHLNTIPYDYILEMDSNRAEDGIDLRYRFGYECKYDDRLIASYLDTTKCSVLEMMIALSLRCEELIMGDFETGESLPRWFWEMINNLGLKTMNDSNFSKVFVDGKIERLLTNNYSSDGRGGLFLVENVDGDLRNCEIWYQMHKYLQKFI